MDISGIGIRSAQELASLNKGTGKEELGRTQFLELMIAQMSHQDPLDPAKNEEFVAQLAQFSTLEGIENLNRSFETVALAMQTSMATQAASLVGRNVVAPTNAASLGGEGGVVGSIELPTAATGVIVDITTESGALVRRVQLGAQGRGRLDFGWDGTDGAGQRMPAGTYHVRAYGEFDGERAELTVNMPARVVSISVGPSGVLANLAGGSSVPASQIKEIQ